MTYRIFRQSCLLSSIVLSLVAARRGRAQDTIRAQNPVEAYQDTNEITYDRGDTISVVRWDSAHSEWAGRLVVGEYLTGVACLACQHHDCNFNALLRRYPTTVFVSLAYHGSFNFPLANPSDALWERWYAWYGNSGQPSLKHTIDGATDADDLIDGRAANEEHHPGGPDVPLLIQAIDRELRRPPEAFFHVQTAVQHGHVLARVTVDSLVGHHPATFLRLALVEDTVNLGPNSAPCKSNCSNVHFRRRHHMVVRGVSHTKTLSLGVPLTTRRTVQYDFDVGRVQEQLLVYRRLGIQAPGLINYSKLWTDSATAAQVVEDGGALIQAFADKSDWLINPLRLHVVVFVQDAHSGEVLQAAMVKVETGPNGARLALPR